MIAAFRCPAERQHRFAILDAGGGPKVFGLAMSCPMCPEPTETEQLAEIVAARRRTLAGVAGLPEPVRAELVMSGALDSIHRGTVSDVLEAAWRWQARHGGTLPVPLRGVPSPTPAEVLEAATRLLDSPALN